MGYLVAIFTLIFLIIIHELGHFVAAKACGVQVNEFSLFFGPELFSWQGKETKYSIRCIPLGGYCAMEGEEENSDNPRAFNKASLWKRALIIVAGPLMNIILALLIMAILMCSTLYVTNTIDYINPGSTADMQGIQSGDVIYTIDGKRVYTASDIDILNYGRTPESIDITVIRDGEKLNFTLSPDYNRYMMNITVATDNNGDVTTVVDTVVKDGAADKAGILPGDKIVAIDGTVLADKYALDRALASSNGREMQITVERGQETLNLSLTPSVAIQDVTTAMGIYSFVYEQRNILTCIPSAIDYFISSARSIYLSFIWLINGTVPVTEVSGPIGIVSTMNDVVESAPSFGAKLSNLAIVASIISINLGVFNLLPIPALDGCKLLFIGCSAITRKEIPAKVEGIISFVGLTVLLIIMVLVAAKDIWGLFV